MKRTLGTVLLLASCSLASRGQAGIFNWHHTDPTPSTTCQKPAAPTAAVTVPPSSSTTSTSPGQVLLPVSVSSANPGGQLARPMGPEAVVEVADKGPAMVGTVGMYQVNNKYFRLAYDFKDVGPSGVAGVEVWFTRNGQTWQQLPGVQRDNPCLVEVPEEGSYGFLLVAKTGFGGGKKPPSTGDKPQLWVEVDQTKPAVFLTGTHLGAGTHALTVTWTATDKNLSPRPIGIYYAEQSAGPWMPIATNLDNGGTFVWQIPPSTPNSFLVRVQASDLAGNVGSTETPSPVQIDLAEPSVTNIRLSAVGKDK